MRATVCPVWELFFVWAYSSQWVLAQTATSASNQPSCCSPKGLHRSSAPAAMHAGNPYWHPDMWGLIGDSYLQMLGVRLWSHPGYSRITSLTVPVWANMDRTHTVQSLTVVSCYLLLICMPESRHDTHTHTRTQRNRCLSTVYSAFFKFHSNDITKKIKHIHSDQLNQHGLK